MPTKVVKHFLNQGLLRTKIDEWLAQNFYEAGYSRVKVVQTSLGTNITIWAERPALIIGRRGATIRRLQEVFQTVFGLPNPRIRVEQPENPMLDARVQAFRIARSIERGIHFRRVAFAAINRIMSNGALGVEITISGKLTSERARFEKFKAGKVYKSGHKVDELVDRASAYARLPKGVIGVDVIIVKPGKPGDHVRIKSEEEVKDVVDAIRSEIESLGLQEETASTLREHMEAARPGEEHEEDREES
ncbi:30S ribosomal protein S3P [Aeropyrum pernix K1]|uniref:Small ribosomal subunit protein uS3 n=1 Tax=Aeropyrum pernix (strain ATCC 700893 / DSM 11879 / JCM 9820 / NBRC 100138 / K1) TaxID=272557 RepID=RS3_AERPE|nr:30S ribosomal protein S3 [Aeropyrum pernix]Q9YF78.1 RecName: Full=Small ribosomal subunit protein uS3; AltName: Full=30S ribosomal protein S3 [Aeropyrum pernix K1]BAA79318.1 30S ribosomal protein S3P [Aeropyrum pernix K1]